MVYTKKSWNTLRGSLIEAVSGDTVIIEFDLGFDVKITKELRILNLQAPPLLTPRGIESKKALELLLKGNDLTVSVIWDEDINDYGCAIVFYAMEMPIIAAKYMVDHGYATWIKMSLRDLEKKGY